MDAADDVRDDWPRCIENTAFNALLRIVLPQKVFIKMNDGVSSRRKFPTADCL